MAKEDKNVKEIRLGDRKRLKALKADDEIHRRVDKDESLTYADVLDVILPEVSEETILERPRDEMRSISVYDADVFRRLTTLAGEGVPAHEVVNHYLNEWEENNE